MATRALNFAAFAGKLLAPLPAAEAPVLDKQTLRDIADDMQRDWDAGMAHVFLARAERETAWWRFQIAGGSPSTNATEYAIYCERMDALERFVARQLLIPAPRRTHLRWKREQASAWALPDAAHAAIAADAARIAPKQEA